VITESEKKFDLNQKRMQDLNKLLFEYEELSVDCYQSISELSDHDTLDYKKLFNADENHMLKSEFDKLVY
jgi:hypothetical protein